MKRIDYIKVAIISISIYAVIRSFFRGNNDERNNNEPTQEQGQIVDQPERENYVRDDWVAVELERENHTPNAAIFHPDNDDSYVNLGCLGLGGVTSFTD